MNAKLIAFLLHRSYELMRFYGYRVAADGAVYFPVRKYGG
jgi:hypothetical protein